MFLKIYKTKKTWAWKKRRRSIKINDFHLVASKRNNHSMITFVLSVWNFFWNICKKRCQWSLQINQKIYKKLKALNESIILPQSINTHILLNKRDQNFAEIFLTQSLLTEIFIDIVFYRTSFLTEADHNILHNASDGRQYEFFCKY